MRTHTIRELLDTIINVEWHFRVGMKAAGSNQLLTVIDQISFMLNNFSPADIDSLNIILRQIVLSQENDDLLRTADLLYYDLSDFLVSQLNIQGNPSTQTIQ